MKTSDPIHLRATFGVEKETRSDPSYRWDSDRRGSDPYVIIQWTLKGSGIFEDRDGRHTVGEGQAFVTLVPEKARYYYPAEATKPWVFAWINFEGVLALEFSKFLRKDFGPVFDMPFKSPCAWSFSQLVSRANKRSFRSSLEESELCYRFFLLSREQQQKRGSLKTSLREIAEYYRQHDNEMIAVKEMADRAGLSREHFTRAFRKEAGVGPAAYLRELKMARAGAMLKRTDMAVSEIARNCGFSTARQFSKTFRHFRGMSPLEFRNSRRSGSYKS